MKNKLKKAGVFDFFDYDEHLLFSSRAGNFKAGNELLKRFFDIRFRIGYSASPTIMKLLDSWEFNHAFFDAYNNTCKHYKHYCGATVRTYFSKVMKHALIAEASSSQVYQRIHTLSLDESFAVSEEAECTLCDIVPAQDDLYSDVSYYMDYMESAETFLNRDFKLSEMDKAIVRLRADGLTYEEIGDALSITISKARTAYEKFYEAVTKTIKTNSTNKTKGNLKKLL